MANLLKTLALGTALTVASAANAELATLSVEVSNVTSNDADFVITCNNPDVPFYYQVIPSVYLEPFGGTDGIYNFQKAEWEGYAEKYEIVWTDFISSSMSYYESAEDKASEWRNIVGGVDYVVFALGMDPEGNLTTNVAFKEFTAVAATPSDNTFEISLISVEDSERGRMKATAKVTPSNNDTYAVTSYLKEFVDKYDLTPGTAGYVDFLSNLMYNVSAESLVSGEQELVFDYLQPDKEYYLVAVGMDENLAPTTAITKFAFTSGKTEPVEPVDPVDPVDPDKKKTIDLQLTNISNMDAHLVLTVSDPDMLYFIDVTRADKIEETGGVDNIPNSQIIEWWKWLATMYSGTDWTEFIPMQCTSGNIDCDLSELIDDGKLSDVYWGTDYVLYAVGFDLEGNVISNNAHVAFTTTKPEKSDITFEFTPISFEKNPAYPKYYDAVVDVTPSNDTEEYMTEYCKTRILDQYKDRDETEDEIIQFQFMDYARYHNGKSRVEMPNLDITDARGDVDYYIIAVGWNDGPTTPIQKYQFNLNTEPGTTGITLEKSDKPFVFARNGRIEIHGAYDAGAVFTVSGQYVGNLRPGRSVSVEPGIYAVHYLADGKNHSVKVLVK